MQMFAHPVDFGAGRAKCGVLAAAFEHFGPSFCGGFDRELARFGESALRLFMRAKFSLRRIASAGEASIATQVIALSHGGMFRSASCKTWGMRV